jgi:hypothetical protein
VTMSGTRSSRFFLTSIYEGELPALPIIDVVLSKENALPFDLWGADAPGSNSDRPSRKLSRSFIFSLPLRSANIYLSIR